MTVPWKAHLIDKRKLVSYLLKFSFIVMSEFRPRIQLCSSHWVSATCHVGLSELGPFTCLPKGHVHWPVLTLYSKGGFNRILLLICGKLTVFFPVVSTKGSEVTLVFVFYRGRFITKTSGKIMSPGAISSASSPPLG
jgi:hypothetical protein